MPIAFLLAMALAQAAPAKTQTMEQPFASSSPEDIAAAGSASNLPKDDYGLVAWCHGALAGQLELDPVAHADMISIEGKAKVAARAKGDAQMEKDRREYLHDYERALAAAEKASPTAIHQYGVDSEVSGYKLWSATRQKPPIWRMLDWGMWDPNDAGCGDAAKRLYNKATLFGEALKGSASDKAVENKADADAPPPPGLGDHTAETSQSGEGKAAPAEPGASATIAEAGPTVQAAETVAPASTASTAAAPKGTTAVVPSKVAKPKAAHAKSAVTKPKKMKVAPTSDRAVTPSEGAPAAGLSSEPTPPALPGDNPLRGPQS